MDLEEGGLFGKFGIVESVESEKHEESEGTEENGKACCGCGITSWKKGRWKAVKLLNKE